MFFQTILKAAAAILGTDTPTLPQTIHDLQPAHRPEYNLTHVVIHKVREMRMMLTESEVTAV